MVRLVAFAVFWGWVLSSLAAQSNPPTSLVTVYFSERPPFTVVDGQTGILLDLTKVVLAEAGLKARFIELPSNRIVELLKGGQPDAMGVGWYRTPEREEWGKFSAALYQDRPPVAVANPRAAAGLANPIRLATLLASGLTLGRKAGSSFGPSLDTTVRAVGIVPLETVVEVRQMLRLIQQGRMDYTFLAEEEATYLLKQDAALSGLAIVHLVDPPVGSLRYFLYPAQFDTALQARIDAAIDKIRLSAKYREIVALE